MTTSRSLSALKLDADSKFTGSNFKSFCDEFLPLLDLLELGSILSDDLLLLDCLELDYILSDNVSEAAVNLSAATQPRDNRLVFLLSIPTTTRHQSPSSPN